MSRQVERGAGRTHPSRLETLIVKKDFCHQKTEFRDKFFHKNNNLGYTRAR